MNEESTDTTNAANAAAISAQEQPSSSPIGVGLHSGPLHTKPAKLLGLDVGEARIGIAVCDPLQLAARPLFTLHRRSRREDFATLAQVVTEHEIQAIVCGLPLNMDDSEGPQAATTRKWALRLAQALRTLLGTSRPLIFWDERLSTYAAQEIIQMQNLPIEEDAAAAAVILQSYLDSLARASSTEEAENRAVQYDSIVLPNRAGQS